MSALRAVHLVLNRVEMANSLSSGEADRPPSPVVLIDRLGLTRPIIGFYDAPDPRPFEPLDTPVASDCVFTFFERWISGRTLHVSRDHYGCPVAARWMHGMPPQGIEDLPYYLVDAEGIKDSYRLMADALQAERMYQAIHPHILIGPLRDAQWPYLGSATFFVNADQLSLLVMGAEYHSAPGDVPVITVPSGPGCMKLMPFQDPEMPQAAIGATDAGMRHWLPKDVLSFTVTRTMLRRLCSLDQRSFLFKADIARMKAAHAE
jgi:hypothetical protein